MALCSAVHRTAFDVLMSTPPEAILPSPSPLLVASINDESINLLLVDINLPISNGLEPSKSQASPLVVILSTGPHKGTNPQVGPSICLNGSMRWRPGVRRNKVFTSSISFTL